MEKGPGVCGGGCTGQPKLTFGGLVFFFLIQTVYDQFASLYFFMRNLLIDELVDGC